MGIVNKCMGVFAVFFISMMFMAYPAYPQDEGTKDVCIVYFTGTGCLNCQITDDFIFNVIQPEYNVKFIVIEYDIYDPEDNGPIADEYVDTYTLPNKIPLVLIGPGYFFVGMDDIRIGLRNAIEYIMTQEGNECPLIDGTTESWENINSGELPGSPEVTEIPPLEEEPPDSQTENETGDATGSGDATDNIVSVIEDVVESEHFPLWIFVTAIFIIIIVVTGLAFGARRMRK